MANDRHRAGTEHRGDTISEQGRVIGNKNFDKGFALRHAPTVAVPGAGHYRPRLIASLGQVRIGASSTPRRPRNSPSHEKAERHCPYAATDDNGIRPGLTRVLFHGVCQPAAREKSRLTRSEERRP